MVAPAGVVFLVTGLGFAAIGVYLAVESRRFARGAATAQGVVVDVEVRRSRRFTRRHWRRSADVLFFPVVRFRPHGGPETTVRSTTGTNPPLHREGSEVTVVYDPSNP